MGPDEVRVERRAVNDVAVAGSSAGTGPPPRARDADAASERTQKSGARRTGGEIPRVNFLAHGFRHVDDPWRLAGTALPDWLRVLDRRARVSPDAAAARVADADARVASLARGVAQHHEDDRRFHGSAVFAETRRAVAGELRTVLRESDGHRAWFVAHLVVEVQLDAAIEEAAPGTVDAYYRSLARLDAEEIERVTASLVPAGAAGLARLVRGFLSERFLAEYGDSAAVVRRVDRVVRRARQPSLPASMAGVLERTRGVVAARRIELLS